MSSILAGIGVKEATAKIILNVQLPGDRGIRPTGLINLRDRLGNRVPIYTNGDAISGHVAIGVRPGSSLMHQGMWVELVGQIVYRKKKSDITSASTHDFLVQKKEISPPGQITSNQHLKFQFNECELPYESYFGSLIQVKYYLRMTCEASPGNASALWRGWSNGLPTATETEFIVHKYVPKISPDKLQPLKMEVGIEDCLHIEFEYDRSIYSLSDVIEGRVIFYLAKLRVRHMEVDLLRVENVIGSDGSVHGAESEVITRFELMDGVPPRHTEVPVRMFLSGQPTTQTLENVANRFSVKYFLNLVLVDEEDRRYFKKQEIFLIRAPQKDTACGEASHEAPTRVDASMLNPL